MNHTNELNVSTKTAHLHLVLKDAAASDGLKVLNMYMKSLTYGTSTAVGTKSAPDTFALT